LPVNRTTETKQSSIFDPILPLQLERRSAFSDFFCFGADRGDARAGRGSHPSAPYILPATADYSILSLLSANGAMPEFSRVIYFSGILHGEARRFDVQLHSPTRAPAPLPVEDGQLLLMICNE
jgi:hypothetical protein